MGQLNDPYPQMVNGSVEHHVGRVPGLADVAGNFQNRHVIPKAQIHDQTLFGAQVDQSLLEKFEIFLAQAFWLFEFGPSHDAAPGLMYSRSLGAAGLRNSSRSHSSSESLGCLKSMAYSLRSQFEINVGFTSTSGEFENISVLMGVVFHGADQVCLSDVSI